VVVITKRTVEVELAFIGNGTVVEDVPNSFTGGVPDPVLSDKFSFNVLPEFEDDDGNFAPPVSGAVSYAGMLQVNLAGTSADFRELGRYFLSIAELDTRADPGFHEHHDDLVSEDGETRVSLIVRKIAS
jgi:hypothetical protein